jgi:hypothetical protein
MRFSKQINSIQCDSVRGQLSEPFESPVPKPPPPPPPSPVKESQYSLASSTGAFVHTADPDNQIIGTYNHDDKTVSFHRTYSSHSSGIVDFGAIVSLEKQKLSLHGLSPSTDVRVSFPFTNFKVWRVVVDVPYEDVMPLLRSTS